MASGPRTPIIIADDDAALRAVMAEVLSEAGFFVFTAASGEDLLTLIASGVHPCLIVCDLIMPGMDATELLARLAENERTQRVPIAIMTGSRLEQLPHAAYVLRKPFTLIELVDIAKDAGRRDPSRDSGSGA